MKMKRLLISAFLVFAILFTLSACFFDGGRNDEYLEFREKICTVLEDNGIELVRDMETASAGTTLLADVKTTDMKVEEILNLTDKAADKRETGVKSYYNDAFEVAFYTPLILGDAITTSKGATEFYGVCIKGPSPQWFMTEKEGELLTTNVYTDTGSDVIYIVFKLDYKSDDDYSFYCYQYTGDLTNRLFIYGDNNGDFVFLRYQTGENKEAFVLTRRGEGQGYILSDEVKVSEAMDIVADEFSSFDQEKIAGLKNSVDYEITNEEYVEAQKKIFPAALEKDKGLLFNIGENENLVYGYGAEGESVIELPEDQIYGTDFTIYDYSGDARELILPERMTFSEEALEHFANGYAFNIILNKVYSQGAVYEHTLEKISVKPGNEYFKEIDGSLYDISGDMLIYFADNPELESVKLDFKSVPRNGVSGLGERKHFGIIKSFEFPLVSKDEGNGESTEYNLFENVVRGTNPHITENLYLSIDTLTVHGVTDRYYFYNDYSPESRIGKITLSGDFESVIIFDEDGLIEDVELKSTVKDAYIHKQSDLPSYEVIIDLVITESYQFVEIASFEKVRSIRVMDGVTYFSANITIDPNDEMDVYIPESLMRIDLPSIKMPENKGDKGSNKELFVFGNYRVHLPIKESEYQGYIATHPDMEYCLVSPYVKVFTDTDFDTIEAMRNLFEPVLGGEGLLLKNYYGSDDVIVIPESIYGIPVYDFQLGGDFIEGKTAKVGFIKEIHIPKNLKSLIFMDANMSEKYHFGKVVFDGDYNQFTHVGIMFEDQNPNIGQFEQFRERYDLLVTDDKTMSPLDITYNMYTSFEGVDFKNIFLDYKHADKSYTFSADFNGKKIGGVLNDEGRLELDFTVNGESFTLIFTHDGIVFEPVGGFNLRKFTITLIGPDGKEQFEEILDDRV